MKKKVRIAIICTLIIISGMIIILNVSTECDQIVENGTIVGQEIQPEEEISEETNYETSVKLFFLDETSGILSYEERLIDARKLIDNPYSYIVSLLINGPEKRGLKSAIPEGTRVNSAIIKNGTLLIDLSEEFLNSEGSDAVYSIVNTLCEFNEVNNIKFTINGEERDGLKELFVKKE